MNSSPMADNTPEELLAGQRVAILGLGLMGGSLAMALHGRCQQLLGYDPAPQAVQMAKTLQVVENASSHIDEIVPQADLIILAAPVKQILRLLAELDQLHPGPAMVLDIGSTKRQVMAAMQALAPRFDPLGGHPICGKEKASLMNAAKDLFMGAPFVLCRLERTSGLAAQLAVQLVLAIGAYPLWLEAEVHDRWIAATSHLPYLLANALVQATSPEVAPLVGPGYRSTARLAAGYAPMMLDVLETNRDMILPAIHAYRSALGDLERHLQGGDWVRLASCLQNNAEEFAGLASGSPAGGPSGAAPC